jgi:hypothetical protein
MSTAMECFRCDTTDELDRLVALIRCEQRRKMIVALDSLWRVGDGVLRLKTTVGAPSGGRTLALCAARAGVHASSLDEAARASERFGRDGREALFQRIEDAGAEITPSHVVLLARATPRQRKIGLEALLRRAYSVRELRGLLFSKSDGS